jgi:golgi phosphoprotein 3
MFTLYEELLLLSIHEEKGTFIGSTLDQMKPGLAGAVLAELALMGKIQASNNHRLQLIADGQTDIGLLDEVLHVLKEAEKERKFSYWIDTFSKRSRKLRKQITESLIKKNVITQEDDRLLWVNPSPVQTGVKASTKYWMKKRLRSIVLAAEETPVEPRDMVLLSLLRACDLLDLVFLRDECKLANRYINQLIFSHGLNDPVIQTVQEIEAVVADLVEED